MQSWEVGNGFLEMQVEGAGQPRGRNCVSGRGNSRNRGSAVVTECGLPGKLGAHGPRGPEEGGCEGRARMGLTQAGGSPSS